MLRRCMITSASTVFVLTTTLTLVFGESAFPPVDQTCEDGLQPPPHTWRLLFTSPASLFQELLTGADGRRELRLSDAQVTKSQSILEKFAPTLKSTNTPVSVKEFQADLAHLQSLIEELLTQHQVNRLREICRQLEGPFGIRRGGIAGMTLISRDQEAAITDALETFVEVNRRTWAEFFVLRSEADPRIPDFYKSWSKASAEYETRSLAVLTPEQRRAWLASLGRPFSFPPAMLWDVVWSPDNTQVVGQASWFGPHAFVAVITIKGRVRARVSETWSYSTSPTFSPDGSSIVYSSKSNSEWDLYLMKKDGSGMLRLTRDMGANEGGSFSPKGDRIVFGTMSGTMWTIAPDGSHLTRVGKGYLPAFSPDGGSIIYQDDKQEENLRGRMQLRLSHICLIKADGSDLKALPVKGHQPFISPDGRQVVYIAHGKDDPQNQEEEVWLAAIDGSNPKQLTHTKVQKSRPTFASDGQSVLFSQAAKPGEPTIYRINIDGSGLRPLLDR